MNFFKKLMKISFFLLCAVNFAFKVKLLFSAILFCAFFISTFHKGLIVVRFYLNQEQIAKTLCENKNKPKLKCNGKCQLGKQLKKEEQKEQQQPELKLDNKLEVISSKSFFATIVFNSTTIQKRYLDFSDCRTIDRPTFVFHPPGSIC
ncbi:MAG TPA: hypothetical protein DIW54_11550 [Chitinophagaceae bacterium]|nr:hypothetical protein [Chitinophagaceae bacterium]HCT23915.1 hypothetical protein [Chitinophagaceae bacterium]